MISLTSRSGSLPLRSRLERKRLPSPVTRRPAASARAAAFTIVELLIVVGIIAVLAAIATPHLLEAQMRSKVARAKADLRTIRTALEAYAVDSGSYPLNAGGLGFSGALDLLTTPRQYLVTLPKDLFQEWNTYFYLAAGNVTNIQQEKFGSYLIASAGPNRVVESTLGQTTVYDPTNGTVSGGDIVMTHKSSEPTGN